MTNKAAKRRPYKEFDIDSSRPSPINMWHFARYIELALACLRYEVDCGVDIHYPRNRKRSGALAKKIRSAAREVVEMLPRLALEYEPLAAILKNSLGGEPREQQ